MMKEMKKQTVYAFIDSQNLNLGVRSQGWKLDWRKFRQYLRSKYGVEKAYLFIGQLVGKEALYTSLQEAGYILVLKPTLERKELGKIVVKGNVDAELVLHTMIHYKDYQKALIVSGDGDFHCLIEYLSSKNKLLYVMVPNKHYSSLLRRFSRYVIRIDWLRKSLEYKKTGISGRSKP